MCDESITHCSNGTTCASNETGFNCECVNGINGAVCQQGQIKYNVIIKLLIYKYMCLYMFKVEDRYS